jgi:DNA repair exonuclease SbcCD ATPase subunit
MKKAFDQNVSRSRPRLRVGALTEAADEAKTDAQVEESADLGVKLDAIQAGDSAVPAPPSEQVQAPPPPEPLPRIREPRASTPADPARRREQLKERLRAVRENPRPEPLPPTVAEAGVLVVERISSLQAELQKLKALNLALTQDLEAARRQAEKATEEARIRMEESRRLSTEMQGRVQLLDELERELSSLEAERNEALLALQDARQGLSAAAAEKEELGARIAEKDRSLADALNEEERLCGELESARDEATALRRSVDALSAERETLARQVAELTAERAELLEARKALEAVHRALSNAVR